MALGVLDREDFAMMETVQSNLAAGLQREVMFGRNEIGLQNFHRVRDAALAGLTAPRRSRRELGNCRPVLQGPAGSPAPNVRPWPCCPGRHPGP